jgi:hypothetical protein
MIETTPRKMIKNTNSGSKARALLCTFSVWADIKIKRKLKNCG